MSKRASFIMGRALPLGVFGFLVAIQGELAYASIRHAFSGDLPRADAMYLLNRVLTVAFFGFLVAIYVLRGKAVAYDHNPVAVAAALIGSFVLYALYLVPGQSITDIRVLAVGDICLAGGMVWALYSLSYLRHRFSIVPEARGLVTTGPYEVVRHPLYLGEIVAGFGLVLPTLLSAHILVLAVFIGAQITRTYFEERVLRTAYPTYEAYARRTRRLIPFIL
ncbi:MAG TPA: isoprenylcysteine carboxylmethyltransferase family protein [Candidatus Angelobacter sp.]|jgi:protein-S-isoprenylcysteine O-methyltransferase Ste14|nr:isoprenylcysteine carboxylmethyltransferase family protein [Candidatus Angelobacter sp.]